MTGMDDKNLALVLGGGGAAGNAWTIGVLAGLADSGLNLSSPGLVIGTSSGATAAAQVLSGIPLSDLYTSILAQPATVGRQSGAANQAPTPALFERMRAIGGAATSAADLQKAMGLFGLESDVAFRPTTAAQRRELVASRLPSHEWPDRPMIIVALNAHTGDLVKFDRTSGVSLIDAITAGTALPGAAPTHEINGVRYINGGVRSAENADLAEGFTNVVVLSPFGGRVGELPAEQFEGLRRFPGADLESQTERLRQQGSTVSVITPDDASRLAMGTNQMDPRTRIPSARAGFEQGKRQTVHLRLAS